IVGPGQHRGGRTRDRWQYGPAVRRRLGRRRGAYDLRFAARRGESAEARRRARRLPVHLRRDDHRGPAAVGHGPVGGGMDTPFRSGLEGVIVAETEISHVAGADGRLIYRGGYPIEEVADRGYEE